MKFGEYFKQQRLALGISLREFCRRNAFDAGNISRLERGKFFPPQSKDLLETYAKALNLQPNSSEWHEFFDLATVENISPQIQDSPLMRNNLPNALFELREKRAGWTKSVHIEQWADFIAARYLLPRLIKRLIRDSVIVEANLRKLEMPAEEGVQRPGADGLVEVIKGNEFVPSGLSVWELGANKNPKKKAEEDFQKRTKNFEDFDKEKIVFIFVTPRKWTKKNEWCKEKKKLGIWSDVRVYDSANLEEWLDVVPSVDLWFSNLIGIRPEGMTPIETYWGNLSTIIQPNLTPQIFLASRSEQVKAIQEWLEGPAKALFFEAHSPNEVIDFIAAYLAGLGEEKRDELKSQIVIVEDKSAWRSLASGTGKFALIPKPSLEIDAEMVSEAVRHGHHVLIPSSNDSIDTKDPVRLSRVYYSDLEKALIDSGFSEEIARRLSHQSGGSLSILKRRLPGVTIMNKPEWAKPNEALELMPILLLGGWEENYEADKKAVTVITGKQYEEVLSMLNRWRASSDPLIMRVRNSWYLVSREDSWELLASYLSPVNIEKFEKLALEVLTENDPRYDLPIGERWYAALKKKTPKYSPRLKKGIIETLGLLGAKPPSVSIGSITLNARVQRIVQKLLTNAHWKRWASLEDYLPLLAEAAPEALLDAIEKDLNNPTPELFQLFKEEGDPLFSSCLYAGLLWALEALAWNPSYLTRVTFVLAKLVENDPGGKWTNRPINSLTEIFLPLKPQTTASTDQRLAVLSKLTTDLPTMAWEFILRLLPYSRIVTNTHRPSWRDWALSWSPKVTRDSFSKQVQWCGEYLVENAGVYGKRWKQLIDQVDDLPKHFFDKMIAKILTVELQLLTVETKQCIFDALREKLHHHRAFSTADWAMTAEMLNALEEAKKRFEPSDLLQKYKWLFVGWPELPEEKTEVSYEKRQEIIFQRRFEAVQEIVKDGGLKKVIALAELVESPYVVGVVLAKIETFNEDVEILPKLIDSKDRRTQLFAFGFSAGRFGRNGWNWIDGLPLKNWQPEQIAFLGLALPFERKAWEMMEKFGSEVIQNYWSRVDDFYNGKEAKDAEYAISMLLKFHRPFRAVNVIGMARHNKCKINSELIIEILETCLKPGPEGLEREGIRTDARYEIQELFGLLQADTTIDQNRLASLEWAYLSLLEDYGNSKASPKILNRMIQEDAKFFADVLTKIYRSKKEAKRSPKSITKQEKTIAENAYRLLNGWKTIPGNTNGSVDEQQLFKWVTEARTICDQSGHSDVCDTKIGQLFAHSPTESDGSWPCIPVRNVIEKIKSERIERGFEMGIFNGRGCFSKSLREGGAQERALSKTYGDYAKACELLWPRVAASLARVAKSYESEAQMEDEEVGKEF